MKRNRLLLGAALVAWGGQVLGAAPANVNVRQAEQGMMIRGDQEAPLVLYIVPWQEPKALDVPPPPLIPLLPNVFDHERSLVDDPAQRTIKLPKGK